MKNNLNKIFNFLDEIENLKSTVRYIYTQSGRQESAAEHSWRLALLAFVLAQELKLKLDILRATEMALVHDLPEAITGDIDAVQIAEGKVLKADKQKQEKEAIEKIAHLLPLERGKEIYNLWQEYEESKTVEARFIKALDKIETLTQLSESGYKTYDKPEFIANYADQAVKKFSELVPVLKIIKEKLKKEFQKGNIPWKKEYKID